jgi:hypothetical protein
LASDGTVLAANATDAPGASGTAIAIASTTAASSTGTTVFLACRAHLAALRIITTSMPDWCRS